MIILKFTYLNSPPPLSSVHVMEESKKLVWVRIMTLREEDEMTSKVGLAVKCADALQYVAEEHIVDLTTNNNFVALEARSSCWQGIHEGVHLCDVLVRQLKLLLNLKREISIKQSPSVI